jgi:uncharacterized sulfatase
MQKKHLVLLPHRLLAFCVIASALLCVAGCSRTEPYKALAGKPNFLLIVTDDQSWLHNSFAGYPAIKTPNFDRLAREGVYFDHAYASAPSCTASRTAILAGQHFWRTGSGAQLWGEYPSTLPSYQRLLRLHGYKTGYTGKGWGPGVSADRNPAGPSYNSALKQNGDAALSAIDHVENFRRFLADRKPGQPFSFWLTPTEPHRPFRRGSGIESGIDAAAIPVPPFLPDNAAVRSDIADYLHEIEYFDAELGRVLNLLEQAGELDNTVIVYTSDNGMPFPRAKSTNYEYGTHMPLAVRWGAAVREPRRVGDFVGLIDLAPTFLTLAGVPVPSAMSGRDLSALLRGDDAGPARDAAFSGTERHIYDARPGHAGYPARAIHTAAGLYIRNFRPELWPAGDAPAYADIDNGSPSKEAVVAAGGSFLELATAKRPAEELYLPDDPNQLRNVADDSRYGALKNDLARRLLDELQRSGDPRVGSDPGVFDRYPYSGPLSD